MGRGGSEASTGEGWAWGAAYAKLSLRLQSPLSLDGATSCPRAAPLRVLSSHGASPAPPGASQGRQAGRGLQPLKVPLPTRFLITSGRRGRRRPGWAAWGDPPAGVRAASQVGNPGASAPGGPLGGWGRCWDGGGEGGVGSEAWGLGVRGQSPGLRGPAGVLAGALGRHLVAREPRDLQVHGSGPQGGLRRHQPPNAVKPEPPGFSLLLFQREVGAGPRSLRVSPGPPPHARPISGPHGTPDREQGRLGGAVCLAA